jgi:predicted nucleic acid-binding protein
VTRLLLLDNSAWARLGDPRLPDERVEQIATALESGQIAVCLAFLLEAGYSARHAREHEQLIRDLQSLPRLAIDEDTERRALETQAQLARAGHHRLPPVDVIVAALADRHGAGVLHYDHDYDVILERTDLRYDSVWLAPAGPI